MLLIIFMFIYEYQKVLYKVRRKVMLRVMICEDNEVHRVKLKQIVENTILREKLDLDIVLATENPQEIISYIKENRSTGIYLLDVDLKMI